jgi:hypothetical protein
VICDERIWENMGRGTDLNSEVPREQQYGQKKN